MPEIVTRYEFWLGLLAVVFFALERLRPWRAGQRLLRPELGQDLFWLVFNGAVFMALFGGFMGEIEAVLSRGLGMICDCVPEKLQVLAGLPIWLQAIVVLVVADLTEWLVHNSLHRVNILWRFHRVHHSIEVMDWIGNFRFHWFETIFYRTLKYLPLAVLGASWQAILIVAVFATAIGNLNHSNLRVSWGPLRYVLNSPRMHVWHHDKDIPGPGVNFGIVLSVWDWLFGTAHMPLSEEGPKRFGYRGEEKVSHSLPMRFFLPFLN